MEFERFEKRIWLASPTMHGDEMKYMQEAYDTNWMSTVGANINEVERITCEKVGCKYAVALSAGTAALHLAVKLAGVKPGDKVFCSDLTFGATVNPVKYEGGEPVFIDTEYDTWNMDPAALAMWIHGAVRTTGKKKKQNIFHMESIAGFCISVLHFHFFICNAVQPQPDNLYEMQTGAVLVV